MYAYAGGGGMGLKPLVQDYKNVRTAAKNLMVKLCGSNRVIVESDLFYPTRIRRHSSGANRKALSYPSARASPSRTEHDGCGPVNEPPGGRHGSGRQGSQAVTGSVGNGRAFVTFEGSEGADRCLPGAIRGFRAKGSCQHHSRIGADRPGSHQDGSGPAAGMDSAERKIERSFPGKGACLKEKGCSVKRSASVMLP